eukprot:9949921-Alexandrium_andersonii.AAC.1
MVRRPSRGGHERALKGLCGGGLASLRGDSAIAGRSVIRLTSELLLLRRPPLRKCKMASGVRSLNCAGPGKASNSIPGALEECVPRGFSR